MPTKKPQTYEYRVRRLRKAGLPLRSFLYTIDQICDLLGLPIAEATQPRNKWIYYYGINAGLSHRGKLQAHNIGPAHSPDWRVSEDDLVRWLESRGWNVTDAKQILSPTDKD